MFSRITCFASRMLHDGGPSTTRLINLVVAGTGAWLLYYWAKAGGDMGWPWCVAFIAYLAYGAGPVTLQKWFDALKAIRGGQGESSETSSKAPQ